MSYSHSGSCADNKCVYRHCFKCGSEDVTLGYSKHWTGMRSVDSKAVESEKVYVPYCATFCKTCLNLMSHLVLLPTNPAHKSNG